MSASFVITLDTKAPANPALLINGGAALTASRAVWLGISTTDFEAGARDVSEMKVWGDVDPAGDLAVQPLEGDSSWLPYDGELAVMLSTGTGRKHLYARLRDDVGNETLPFTDFIDLDETAPAASIVTAVDRGRISKVTPYDAATFTWEANVAFTAYQVRVVPSAASTQQAGVLIPTTAGSLNISGAGLFNANDPITTTIRGADLETASPGDTTKVVKVFVMTSEGVWSS